MTTIKTFAMSEHAATILNKLAQHYQKNEIDIIEQLIKDHVIHDLDKDVATKIIEAVRKKYIIN